MERVLDSLLCASPLLEFRSSGSGCPDSPQLQVSSPQPRESSKSSDELPLFVFFFFFKSLAPWPFRTAAYKLEDVSGENQSEPLALR